MEYYDRLFDHATEYGLAFRSWFVWVVERVDHDVYQLPNDGRRFGVCLVVNGHIKIQHIAADAQLF